ncbi:helix-turn-helix domain-containing protein [Pseudobutyrivibrio sp.]
MQNYRQRSGLSYKDISRKCGVSDHLIEGIEEGYILVTHPNIVKKLDSVYQFTEKQFEELLPENRRPSSPNYDPDKYVQPILKKRGITIPKRPNKQRDEYAEYMHDLKKRWKYGDWRF